MTINFDLASKIIIPLVTLILGKYLDRWLTKRPRLISYLGHTSSFTLKGEKPVGINTHAIVLRNTGRIATTNVRIGHYVLPENYQIIPSVQHSVESSGDGNAEIVIPTLVPEEQITISYLYFPPLLWNQIHAYIKSDDGFAKILSVLPTPQFPKWIIRTVWSFVFIGIAALLYLIVTLVHRFF